MTEKRFKNIGNDIWQGDEVWCVAGGEHCASVIAEALNMQEETITRLEKENESRKAYQRTLEDKIRRLKNRIKVLE